MRSPLTGCGLGTTWSSEDGTCTRRSGSRRVSGAPRSRPVCVRRAEFGQVVAALPFGPGASGAWELRTALDGKVLIDCSHPVGPGFRLLIQRGLSAAQQLGTAAPTTHVVKAFNLCHEDVWRMTPPIFDGRPLAVPVCGGERPSRLYTGWCSGSAASPGPALVANERDSWKPPLRPSSGSGSARRPVPKQSHPRWPAAPDRHTKNQKTPRRPSEGIRTRRGGLVGCGL
jgi:hypothetical protein